MELSDAFYEDDRENLTRCAACGHQYDGRDFHRCPAKED